MFRYSLSWYIFAFTLLELIIKTHPTLHDSSHGFISKNPRYFDEDLSNIHEEITSSLRMNNDASSQKLLKFEPSFLDFKLRPLGVPHMEKVTLFNIDNKSIDMTSISGNTVHFHSSFFQDKRIPPMGNTSFNVVYLGREEGFVESSLFIHTSEGHLKYNVKGASTFSHYRLRPIVGIKLPLNSSYSPLIYMHNPHSEPIQVVEIYSSGGDFHLELPSGEQEGPNDMWEIPPLQTKAIIRVRFQAKVVQNHTAYVRIKINRPDEILVVPLEVEVTSTVGIFHPQGAVDFGIGGSLDAPKQVKLCVHNPIRKPIRIHSVTSTSEAITISYENVRLPAAIKSDRKESGCVDIGTLTVNWQKAYETKDFSGKIVVKFRNGKNKSEIPYYVTVLKGGISFDSLTTTYFINDQTSEVAPRYFKVRNDFLMPVRLLNVTIPEDAQSLFSIDGFVPRSLKPQEEINIFKITLKNCKQLSDLKVNTNILLKTNVSDILIPFLSYNGKLQVHLPFKSKDYSLDLGMISYDSKKEVYFSLVNHNPVDVALKNIRSSIPMTSAEFFGCGSTNYQLALFQVNFHNLTKCIYLKSGSYVILKLIVQTSNSEGQIWGDIQIETQFENLSVPVHFKIAPGKLEIGPDRLVFDQCFPGKICSHPLRVHSTFNEPMVIEDIISLPPDKRISSKHSGHILARATKVIGHLFLNPNVDCNNECYTGMQHDSTAQWLKTFSLSKFVPDFDMHLVNVFYNRYINLTSNGVKKWQNLTMRLDTTEVRGHIFKTRVKMSWPSLVLEPQQNIENKSVFTFPLTQVGNVTYRNITIKNPSSYNLVVQLVLDKAYPNVEVLYDGLPSSFIPVAANVANGPGSMDHRFFFRNSPEQLSRFRQLLDVEVSDESFPMLLAPGENCSVAVGFHAQDTHLNSALLFIRNNLTILEVVRLKGQGALPLFKFGNRKPGSPQPLSFEMTEKHLKDCERDKQFVQPTPNLTVKRSFTARNIGDVTIYVNTFHINDFACEGYGFKVVNCVPFVLPPNATKKIDIAFTPDLTLTKVTRTLIMGTSLNVPVNYTLFTTIPSHYLGMCNDLIMRPTWEVYLSYATIGSMSVLLLCIIAFAVLDAERIKHHSIGVFISPNSPSVQPVLDLRLVGQQTREEIRSTKVENSEQKAVPEKIQDKSSPKDPIKNELEKYTVLIPATGKTKKKLAKKISNETSVSDSNDIHKKPAESPPKPPKSKPEIIKPEEKERKTFVREVKKPLHKHKHTKNITIVPAAATYEEETSSTTTESSSNNEDPEKENQRTTKICSKKIPSNKAEATKMPITTEPLIPEEKPTAISPVTVDNKVDKPSKSVGTTRAYQKNKNRDEGREGSSGKHNRDKKNNKTGKQHKDKQQHKKNLTEKKSIGETNRLSPNLRVSSPVSTQASVWSENRVKFSDVVARTETVMTTNNRPLMQTNTTSSKPTMYVEPYKQTTQELGPIGSRRVDYWQENNSLASNVNNMDNSFFSNNVQDMRVENNPFWEEPALENWNTQPTLANLIENNLGQNSPPVQSTSMEDPWNHNLLNSNSYWSNNFTPLLPEHLATEPPAAAVNQSSDYFWGCNPVWQPWAPVEVPRTPTRTPPGFDEFIQRKQREEQTQSQRDTYSPFNTANIWTNQQPNPWNYSGQ